MRMGKSLCIFAETGGELLFNPGAVGSTVILYRASINPGSTAIGKQSPGLAVILPIFRANSG
jgi:hypothetical protein